MADISIYVRRYKASVVASSDVGRKWMNREMLLDAVQGEVICTINADTVDDLKNQLIEAGLDVDVS